MRNIVLFILAALGIVNIEAQENLTSYFEPGIEIGYQVTDRYAHSFGLENRNYIYKDSDLEYAVKQLDVSHFSKFDLRRGHVVGFGIQYRLENWFNGRAENELRLMQEYEWKSIGIDNRFRNEQRFFASGTKYRLRYELGVTFPLIESAATETYLKIDTESLFEIGNAQKPELEQRFGSGFGQKFSEQWLFEIGIQYRLTDYTQKLGHEIFLIAGWEITL
jgi:hypothetical protein